MIKRPVKKKAKKKAKPLPPGKRHALWELAFGGRSAWTHGKVIYEELKTEKKKTEKSKKAPKATKSPKAPKSPIAPKKRKAPKPAPAPKAPKRQKRQLAA